MSYVLDSGDALRIVIIGVVLLLTLGTALAWAPAFRFDPMVIPARLFLGVSAVTIAADARGVGLVLGFGLALLSVLLWWRTQPEPEIPRPQLQGVFIAVLVTAVAATAALNGWFWFSRIPDAGTTAVGLAIGAVGALGTLAVADRARIRERDAIRRRFRPVQPNPLLVVLDEDEQADEQSFPRPRRPGDVMAVDVSGLDADPPTPATTSADQMAVDSPGDDDRLTADQSDTSVAAASRTAVQTEPDQPPDSQAEPRLPRPTTPPDADDGAPSAAPADDERTSAQAPSSQLQDPEPSRQSGDEPGEKPDDVAATTTTTESTVSAKTVAEGQAPASGSATTATSATKTSGSSKKRPGGTTRPAKKTTAKKTTAKKAAAKAPTKAGASPSASGQGAAKKGASKKRSRASTSDATMSDDTNGDGSNSDRPTGDETSGAAAYVSTTANSDHAKATNGDAGSGTDGSGTANGKVSADGTANGKVSTDGTSNGGTSNGGTSNGGTLNGAASRKRTTATGATGNGKAHAEKTSSAPEQKPNTTQEKRPGKEQ